MMLATTVQEVQTPNEEVHDMLVTTVQEVQMVIFFTVSLPGNANLAWCSVV